MLVAARNASFFVAYGKVGLSPGDRTAALPSEFVSRRVLTELCLTGEPVTGERMHGLGIVNRLVDSGRALTEAISMAVTFATGPQRVIVRIKTLRRHADNTLEAQLELEARHVMESVALH
ncbi:enoyl-CoA hydratase/carnithine racemase [Paraburkholderia sp. MM5384-R2]|nr:enoyl-CoA hydratase/carnithine racemase [Paraburkholderia sp. MM5384-R2]